MGSIAVRRALLAGASFFATAAATVIVCNGPALAQNAPSSAPAATQPATATATAADLGEIVITARQRSEVLREVPIAVTAFTAENIEKAGIERPQDFIQLTPNVSFIQTTNAGESQVHIRGVIQPRDSEPPFAYVLDGVLVPNPNAFNQELVDIQQIEVIKGPIGSIYGRNAIGGAILVTTKRPSNDPEGEVRVGYEVEGEEYKASGYVGGPIIPNKLFARLTASYKDRGGYYQNVTLGEKEDKYEEGLARARVVLEATETLSFDLSAGLSQIKGPAFNFNNQMAGTFGFETGVNIRDTSIPYAGNVRSFNEQDRVDLSAKADWTTGAGTLTATAAYHDLKEDMGGEGAVDLALFGIVPGPTFLDFATNPALFEGYGPTPRDGTQYQERNQDDTSFELRFTSPGENRLRYIAGLYYIDFDREVVLNRAVDLGQGRVARNPLGGPENPVVAVTWTDNANEAYAAFGQLAFDITDDLEVSAALRYDEEKRESTNLTPAAFTPVAGDAGRVRGDKFSDLQPRISLRWNATEDVSVYGTYGEGFRSGGFNPLGSRFNIINIDRVTNTTVQDEFDKETSKSFEAGIKTSLLDRRLSLNAAAFFTTVENAHYFQFFPFSLSRVISIVDKNEIRGFEADATARLSDQFQLFGGLGVIDSEIKRNRELPQTEGNKFPFTPEYSVNAGGQFTTPLGGDLELVARLDYSRTGPIYFDTLNTRGTKRQPLDIVNARLGLETESWSATLFARNLFDERYNVDGVVLVVPGVTTFNFVTKGEPMTWGAELRYRF
ncbi:MAG TPA: TonB-dependent receptor [Azospirillaceae bacterium]|nr:TonB-dependent receptor [Azospirillaceae bacterium]